MDEILLFLLIRYTQASLKYSQNKNNNGGKREKKNTVVTMPQRKK